MLVDLTNAMAQIEGWNVPGSLAQRNNNPLNLRFVGQPGAIQGEGGFAKFPSPEAGFQAGENQITLDASHGLDLQGFIGKFAPPSENNTEGYIGMLTSKLGVSATTKLSDLISNGGFEGGTGSKDSDIFAGNDPSSTDFGLVGGLVIVVGGMLLFSK